MFLGGKEVFKLAISTLEVCNADDLVGDLLHSLGTTSFFMYKLWRKF